MKQWPLDKVSGVGVSPCPGVGKVVVSGVLFTFPHEGHGALHDDVSGGVGQ